MTTGAPAARTSATGKPEGSLWLHDLDGTPVRPITLAQAQTLVGYGAAYPICVRGTWREIRLTTAMPPNSLRTFFGRSTAIGSPVSTFHHNTRACKVWRGGTVLEGS